MSRPNIRYRFKHSAGPGDWEEIYVHESWAGNIKEYMREIEQTEGPRRAVSWSSFEWEYIKRETPKLKWLLETETFEEDIMTALKNAITAHGMEYKTLDYHSWEDDSQFTAKFSDHDCVLFYGSLGAARRIQRTVNWSPGVWMNLPNFECTTYFNKFGKYLLNNNYVMLPFGELERQKDFLFSTLGVEGKLFMRPSSGMKLFNGSLVSRDNWVKDYELLSFYDVEPEKIVVVSRPQNILEEWRLMIVNGKVVCGSRYKPELGPITLPDKVVDFGNEIAAIWQPDPAWTLDVARTEKGLRLIEINSFSCSGMYLCDKMPLVEAVADLAVKEWEEDK